MAADPAPKVDTHHEPVDPEVIRKVRTWALVATAIVVVGGAWWLLKEVNTGRELDKWARLHAIESGYRDAFSTRGWTNPAEDVDLTVRDKHVKALEEFLPTVESEAGLAAHVHALIADVRMSQAFGRMAAGAGADVDRYLADAQKHLEVLRDKFPDAPLNWSQFGRAIRNKDNTATASTDAPSIVRRALADVASLRAWEKANALAKVEPDADTTVLLRTTAGDLRLKVYGSASPGAVKAFLDRVCAGGLDGVRVFHRRERAEQSWLRVGDDRTKAETPTEDDRIEWDEATPGETRPPESGRYRILHTPGTVTSWHGVADSDDDPQQFLIVTKDSPALNFEHTPFARVEDGPSMSTVERMVALATYAKDQPDIRGRKPTLADQIVAAPRIVKAIVYDKGAARACTKPLEDDEKSLDVLKADKYRKDEPPPAPPAAPASMDEAPPAPPAPMDEAPPAMEGDGK
jgi:cyclophilin family peptidyl-prolyl cis-trans isomerase